MARRGVVPCKRFHLKRRQKQCSSLNEPMQRVTVGRRKGRANISVRILGNDFWMRTEKKHDREVFSRNQEADTPVGTIGEFFPFTQGTDFEVVEARFGMQDWLERDWRVERCCRCEKSFSLVSTWVVLWLKANREIAVLCPSRTIACLAIVGPSHKSTKVRIRTQSEETSQ